MFNPFQKIADIYKEKQAKIEERQEAAAWVKRIKEGMNSKYDPIDAFEAFDKATTILARTKALIAAGIDVNAKQTKHGDKKTVLINAIKYNTKEIVKTLINAGADVNAGDWCDKTPLMYAAGYGYPEIVKLLIAAGADINACDHVKITSLMYAAIGGNTETVKNLIDLGADVNAGDWCDKTPLMYAAEYGYPEIVKLLIAAGTDINAKDNVGNSPLMYAARKGNTKTMEILIAAGANVNTTPNTDGKTPLAATVCDVVYLSRRPEAMDILIDAGADVNAQNCTHCMARPSLSCAVLHGDTPTAKKLIAAGANVDAPDKHGTTALMFATSNGDIKLAETLINSGANVNACDNDGDTALIYALEKHWRLETLEFLINAGANVNIKNKNGVTPLMWAADYNMDEAAKLLIRAGAKVNACDNYGDSPLTYAANYKYTTQTAQTLINAGAIDTINKSGKTALDYAVTDEMKYLLRNKKTKPGNQKTKLEEIIIKGERFDIQHKPRNLEHTYVLHINYFPTIECGWICGRVYYFGVKIKDKCFASTKSRDLEYAKYGLYFLFSDMRCLYERKIMNEQKYVANNTSRRFREKPSILSPAEEAKYTDWESSSVRSGRGIVQLPDASHTKDRDDLYEHLLYYIVTGKYK